MYIQSVYNSKCSINNLHFQRKQQHLKSRSHLTNALNTNRLLFICWTINLKASLLNTQHTVPDAEAWAASASTSSNHTYTANRGDKHSSNSASEAPQLDCRRSKVPAEPRKIRVIPPCLLSSFSPASDVTVMVKLGGVSDNTARKHTEQLLGCFPQQTLPAIYCCSTLKIRTSPVFSFQQKPTNRTLT